MSMKYCFKLNDRDICFSIPVAYDPLWWIPPLLKPDPTPWIVDKLLSPSVAKDISILASIDNLSEELTPALRESIKNEVKMSIKKLQLPTEVTIVLSKPKESVMVST